MAMMAKEGGTGGRDRKAEQKGKKGIRLTALICLEPCP